MAPAPWAKKSQGPAPFKKEEPSIWQQIGADLADPGKALQAADDMARIGLDTVSFGYLDPLIGKLSGEDERAKTQAARERAGWAGTGMDVATAVAATPSLAMRAVPAGKGLFKGLARAFGYGAEGAAQSALSAHGHGKSWDEIKQDAITGGVLGSAGQKVGEVVGDVAGRAVNKAKQPFKSSKDLKRAADVDFDAVRKSGAVYKMSDTDKLLQNLDTMLVEQRATAGLDDRVLKVVETLRDEWQGKPIAPDQLDKVRRWANDKLIKPNPKDPLGYRVRDEIDKFARENQPIDPVTGVPNPKVIDTLERGRSRSARQKRVEDLEGAEAKAKRQARKTGSALNSGNLENTRRQKFGKIVDQIDDKGKGGWSADEETRLRQIEKGTLGRNVGRAASAVSPFRGSIPAMLQTGLGFATGGASVPFSVAVEALAQMGSRATKREIEDLLAVARDETGRGIAVDPSTLQQMRDYMAKLFVGGQRAGGD